MSVPENIRESIRAELWRRADKLGWVRLPVQSKATHYEAWAREEAIGGILQRYIPTGRLRLYIKDGIFKNYTRGKGGDATVPLRVLGVDGDAAIAQTYTKPHGRRLRDGRLVTWGAAREWKDVLMAAFERGQTRNGGVQSIVVLVDAGGRFKQDSFRELAENAAGRLGISRVAWLE